MTRNDDSLSKKNVLANREEEMLKAGLLADLYREDCPETTHLGEYQLGLLPEPEQAQVSAHLECCPHCRAELTRLTEFLAEQTVSSTATAIDKDLAWTRVREFEWLREKTGAVIVRLPAEILPPPAARDAPTPVSGRAPAEERDMVRRIKLGPDEVDDLDLEVIVRRSEADPQTCTLTMHVEVPSRRPDLAGTQVRVAAGDWQAGGITDAAGNVTFRGLPVSLRTCIVSIT